MSKLMIQIDDEVREATKAEIDDYMKLQADVKASLDADYAKVAARQSALAKLAALGLTEAEIAAL